MIRDSMLFAIACAILVIQPAFAQSKSAVQFYDTTGTAKTGKVGWSGDATNGHFFVQTPNQGELITSTAGGVEISGTVSATRFSGDGSGLTSLPSQQVTVGSVTGLQDSLNRRATNTDLQDLQAQVSARADTTWVKTRMIIKADTTWVNGTLSIKADTTWVNTKIANIGTAQIPDGAVTTAKIADTAVTAAKIRDRAVIDAKIDSVSWAKVRNKPSAYPPESHSHAQLQVDGLTDSMTAHRTLINAKANSADVYTKAEVNTIVGGDSAMYMRDASTALRISNTSPASFTSLTINAPSDGYVMVWATASIWPWGSTNFCAVSGTISQNSSGNESFNHDLAWPANNGGILKTFSMTRMFQVLEGGNTFYLKFWKADDGVSTYEDVGINSISMTGIFVKTRM